MSRWIEELCERYCRLSKELCESWDTRVKEISSKRKERVDNTHRSLAEPITNELNQMEKALQEGDMMRAEYHKLMAETYIDLIE